MIMMCMAHLRLFVCLFVVRFVCLYFCVRVDICILYSGDKMISIQMMPDIFKVALNITYAWNTSHSKLIENKIFIPLEITPYTK